MFIFVNEAFLWIAREMDLDVIFESRLRTFFISIRKMDMNSLSRIQFLSV
jgi:hypothetical protein